MNKMPETCPKCKADFSRDNNALLFIQEEDYSDYMNVSNVLYQCNYCDTYFKAVYRLEKITQLEEKK